MNEQIRQITLTILKDTTTWPETGVLCMARRSPEPGKLPECAFMVVNEPLRLYYGNVYMIAEGKIELEASKTFASPESIVEEGWEVD